MKIFSFIGFLLAAVGGYGLYAYFTEKDPFSLAENCNPYATASQCDNIGMAYLTIGLTCGGIGVVFLLLGRVMSGMRKREAKFMQSARPGVGKIISIDQPMNVQINNQPLLTFVLEVAPDMGPVVQAKVRSAVSPLMMSQIRMTPGSELPIKYDPANPTDVRIDWNAAAAHQAQAAPAAASNA